MQSNRISNFVLKIFNCDHTLVKRIIHRLRHLLSFLGLSHSPRKASIHIPGVFCVLPWIHRFTNVQGEIEVCCVAPGSRIPGQDGKPIHILDGLRDEEILNTPYMKQLRKNMLEGQWTPICKRCQITEASGGTTRRISENSTYRHLIPQLINQTDDDGTLHYPQVRYLDLRLGNHCNLTCRMCGPQASKLWIDAYNELQPQAHQLSESELSDLQKVNWVNNDSVWEIFKEQIPHLDRLHFAGGEPLIIPEMVDALKFCVESGHSHHIALSYNTNLTKLPDHVTSLWTHFKHVSLQCSIDGYGRLNDYIRRPSRWRDIDRNLREVDRHFSDWKIKYAFVSTTVQVYNVLSLNELYSYLRTEFEHILPLPNLIPLYEPEYLSIQTLPLNIKNLARERLLQEKEHRMYVEQKNRIGWLLENIDSTIDFMCLENLNNQTDNFLEFNRNSDKRFGDNLEAVAPELVSLWDKVK